jgi:hypothetical protein
MKRYRTTAPVIFGEGQELELTTPEQFDGRKHKFTVVEVDKITGGSRVRLTGEVQFKAGEVIGLPEVTRALEAKLEAIDAPAPVAPMPVDPMPAARAPVDPKPAAPAHAALAHAAPAHLAPAHVAPAHVVDDTEKPPEKPAEKHPHRPTLHRR